MEVAGKHSLQLPYVSKCNNEHGHNWIVVVEITGPQLNQQGMLIDFTFIKAVADRLDHQDINAIMGLTNPTAEVMCEWFAKQINQEIQKQWAMQATQGTETFPQVSRVTVQENEGNRAIWTLDTL